MTTISFVKNIFASFAASCLGRITLSIPSPQQLRVIVVSLGIEEMETSGCSLAISIKDDIGEYSVKWEGKWGEEN